MNSLQLSVVICAYNRADLITACLESLAQQSANQNGFEVIVVDNNSSDGTPNLVEKFTGIRGLRLLHETSQGLSHARNRGLAEAQGIFIAYLDDDARAENTYVENTLALISTLGKNVTCFGGPILPFYTHPKPDWFKDEYETRRLRPIAHYLQPGQVFSGSNMVWNVSQLRALGGFNADHGISGNQLILGEETYLFERLWLGENPVLYFSPNLVVYHWVPKNKMTVRYRFRRAFAIGQYRARSAARTSLNKLFSGFIIAAYRCVYSAAKGLLSFPRHAKWQNWAVEELSPALTALGETLGRLNYYPHLGQRD